MNSYTFVRRSLRLNNMDNSFQVIQDELFTIDAGSYEEAINTLVQEIDCAEGRKGVIANDGFPLEKTSGDQRALYLASHAMAVYGYQLDADDSVVHDITDGFLEQLKQTEEFRDELIYQGIYADDQLLHPRGLMSHRLQCNGDEFNYIFNAEGGQYKGEYDRYLYYNQILYTGDESDISRFHFDQDSES